MRRRTRSCLGFAPVVEKPGRPSSIPGLLASVALLCVPVVGGRADVFVIHPDGGGDFPTIQAAIDAARDGDVIELTPGTFSGPGNRDLDYAGKAITVRSQLGAAEVCFIDCDGTPAEPHRGAIFHTGEGAGSVLEAVTITGGCACGPSDTPASWGGAVLCYYSSPRLLDCVFAQNSARDAGGGVLAWGCAPTVSGCTFVGNAAQWGGGMQSCESRSVIRDCVFQDNHASMNGGGFYDRGVDSEVAFVTFIGNSTSHRGGGMACNGVSTRISSCTFYGNQAAEGGGGLWLLHGSSPRIDNTIISFSAGGEAICGWDTSGPRPACCDIYGNAAGDWIGCLDGWLGVDGNICEDPLFCDPQGGDLHLQTCSPCAPYSPPNPECDLIGAWVVACGGSPAVMTSWGALKALFGR